MKKKLQQARKTVSYGYAPFSEPAVCKKCRQVQTYGSGTARPQVNGSYYSRVRGVDSNERQTREEFRMNCRLCQTACHVMMNPSVDLRT